MSSLSRFAVRSFPRHFCTSPPHVSLVAFSAFRSSSSSLSRKFDFDSRLFCSSSSSSSSPPASSPSSPSSPSSSSSSSSTVSPTSHNKLIEILKSEYEQEKAAYTELPAKIKKLLNSGIWKYEEKPGDVNIVLTREVDGKRVTIDFQLVNPNLDGDEGEDEQGGGSGGAGGEDTSEGETTDFSVTIEDLADKGAAAETGGAGVTFYCTTVSGEKYRYLIGNVRLFRNEAEKNSVSGYNGPEFEGLAPSLQESLEGFLESYGIDSEICDLIDEVAIDKETREYTNWLSSFIKLLQKSF